MVADHATGEWRERPSAFKVGARELRSRKSAVSLLNGEPGMPVTDTSSLRAWLQLDVRDRQLSVLRNTFPNWEIGYEVGPSGLWIWRATARWTLTLEMVTAGMLREVQRGDPVSLMAALTWQAWAMERIVRPPA
ncbi:hypothetical protein [Nonomuraea sp. NPDC002799]